jgi:carbon storage regulator CsrA
LLIGDDIEIELLELNSQGAKIGIRAPRETLILRKELKLVGEQNRAAAASLELPEIASALSKIPLPPQTSPPPPDKP